MMLPVLNGTVFSSETWQALAQLSTAFSAWAMGRATEAQRSELELLTERLRAPIRFAVKHPIRATKRALHTRAQ